MALVGRLHPLLIHFPIALLLSGFAAEAVAMLTGRPAWRWLAVASVRSAAVMAALAACAGWLLAGDPIVDPTPLLEWHRWLAVLGTAAAVVAALASTGLHSDSTTLRWVYRSSLLIAAALVAVAAHLGGVLVWGAHFVRL